MKQLLITIAAVLLVGCGPSVPDISIHEAAFKKDIDAIKQILASGVDVNAKDNDGDTALFIATGEGHKDIEAWHQWSVGKIANGFDFVGIKHSDNIVVHFVRQAVPASHLFLFAIFSNHDLGRPMRRSRFYSACLNLDTLVWVGPSAPDITEGFLDLF